MSVQSLSASPSRWARSLRLVAVATVAMASLAACGGSKGPVAAPETSTTADGPKTDTGGTATSGTATSGTATSGTSAAEPSVLVTVPADAPENMIGQVGELEIIGEPLPAYNGNISIEGDQARGKKAPVLVGETFDGKELRIDAAESGKPVLIYFLAHWCAHCNREVPVLNDLRDSNAFLPDLQIYGVMTDIQSKAPNFPPSEWVKKMDWTYPSIRDGYLAGKDSNTVAAMKAFGGSSYPFAVLINADGTVAARWSGETPGAKTISYIDSYLAY